MTLSDPVTLFDKLAVARTCLTDAGISPGDAAIDVDLFARTILGWERARLLTERSSAAPSALEPRFSEWIQRRSTREPSAYIVGVREFWGLDFHVTPAVLIPRPETEFIVEEALRLVQCGDLQVSGDDADRQRHEDRALRVADIGTGCGCIAIAIARELTGCHVVATDVSSKALSVARENATRHGVSDRIEFTATSYLAGVDGAFDLIAANPPYVREGDKPALSRDVRHEPDVALFGGSTGLRDIEGVVSSAIAKLRSGGWLVMEFGFGQEDDVRERVAARDGLRLVRLREDLQGLPRTAVIERL